ncbi:hypothetical protein KDW_30750 [Dictyobacter vulcani]|uniref:Uncharacterized protein n=2 Tax=Dictyobacter vulcani TaxID=2607529 RepID=A0A5J4KME9_9CHLR|nr:hypothetical protein KDW_30750 [Dictyobacter vulcani]
MREMLYGPFPSRNAVDHLAGQNTNAASRGQVIVSSQPIITSGCNNQSFTSSIIFPKQLKGGYYDLYIEGSSSFASGTSTIGSEVPIHIKAD